MPRVYSYKEAADLLGVDHHYVRMLTSRGRFTIAERVEIRPNVLKVYLEAEGVEQYHMAHRVMETRKIRMTEDNWRIFDSWVTSGKLDVG